MNALNGSDEIQRPENRAQHDWQKAPNQEDRVDLQQALFAIYFKLRSILSAFSMWAIWREG